MLKQFSTKLATDVPLDSPLRPFDCDGSPLERKDGIFLVGINPAKELEKNFWHYWNCSYGFEKERLLADLRRQPGGLGPTRRKIEEVVNATEADGRHLVLNTNIYWYPAQSPDDIPSIYRDERPFERLLHELTPKVVLAHGKKDVVSFFQNRCGTNFAERYDCPVDVRLDGLEFQLLCSHHLWLPSVKALQIVESLKRGFPQEG